MVFAEYSTWQQQNTQTIQVNMKDLPREAIFWAIKQVFTKNVKGLKSYKAYLLTTTELNSKI